MKKFIYIVALALTLSFVTSCGSKTTKVETVSVPAAVEVVDSTIVDTLLIDSIVVDSVVAE